MILDKALSLIDLSDKLELAGRIENEVATFRKRQDELEALERRLCTANQFLVLAHRLDLVFPLSMPLEQGVAATTVGEFARDFVLDPGVIVQGNRYRDLLSTLESAVRGSEQVAREIWRAYVRQFAPASDEVLDLYGKLGLFASEIGQLRVLSRTLARLAEQPWVSDIEFDTFKHGVGMYETLWARVDLSALPASVQRFLRASGEAGGASLDLLTAEVHAWLRENEATQLFRIRPYNSSAYGPR